VGGARLGRATSSSSGASTYCGLLPSAAQVAGDTGAPHSCCAFLRFVASRALPDEVVNHRTGLPASRSAARSLWDAVCADLRTGMTGGLRRTAQQRSPSLTSATGRLGRRIMLAGHVARLPLCRKQQSVRTGTDRRTTKPKVSSSSPGVRLEKPAPFVDRSGWLRPSGGMVDRARGAQRLTARASARSRDATRSVSPLIR
jgi:hypothetical protein